MDLNKDSRKKNLQYVPKVSKGDDKIVDKGKEIVLEELDPLHIPAKENVSDMVGPSNPNVTIETIIDSKAFLGVNNVPDDDPAAQNSLNPLLGFVQADNSGKAIDVNNDNLGIVASGINVGNSPIKCVLQGQDDCNLSPNQGIVISNTGIIADISPNKGVIEVHDNDGNLSTILQAQRIVECSDDTIVADSQSSNANQGNADMDYNNALVTRRSTTSVSPVNSIRNQTVAADMRIISPLWSQEEDNLEEDIPTPISMADPSKYLVDVPVVLQEDPNVGFTTVLSKSMKKKNRQKAARLAQAERNISRLRDGPKHYA